MELMACVAPLMSSVSVAFKVGCSRPSIEVWEENIRICVLSEK